MTAKKLTAKQKMFCREYLVDLNATQAAIRAGYSKKTAPIIGFENLHKPNIAEVIAERMAKREEKVEINAEYVLRRLHEIESFDSTDMYNEDGTLKNVSEWPERAGMIISGIDVSTVTRSGSTDETCHVMTKKIKIESRTKALELLGKHVNVKAFEKEGMELPEGVEFHFHLDKK